MPSFIQPSGVATPFGRNEFLRSTQDVKTESYTLAASTVPAQTINNVGGQKIIQPGTIMAKITSGTEQGKIGPYDADATDGRETAANIVGLLLTFLPWQLQHHDEAVSVVYEGSVVKAWCQYLDNGDFVSASTLTWASTVGASAACRFIIS